MGFAMQRKSDREDRGIEKAASRFGRWSGSSESGLRKEGIIRRLRAKACLLLKRLGKLRAQAEDGARRFAANMQSKTLCEKAQGTTEYAILVGVLVVIAILAITVFRPKLQELWDAIATGISGL